VAETHHHLPNQLSSSPSPSISRNPNPHLGASGACLVNVAVPSGYLVS
jgi:hypothetical protein